MHSFDPAIVRTRFITNMRRLGQLTTFLTSAQARKDQHLTDEVIGDIYRASVVLLQATFEDYVRSHLRRDKKLDFYTTGGLKKIARKLCRNEELVADLIQPLFELTKRRHKIVHHADLGQTEHDRAKTWGVADLWLLSYWNLAVVAFQRRLEAQRDNSNVVDRRARANVDASLQHHLKSGRALASLKLVGREDWTAVLEEAITALNEANSALVPS